MKIWILSGLPMNLMPQQPQEVYPAPYFIPVTLASNHIELPG